MFFNNGPLDPYEKALGPLNDHVIKDDDFAKKWKLEFDVSVPPNILGTPLLNANFDLGNIFTATSIQSMTVYSNSF